MTRFSDSKGYAGYKDYTNSSNHKETFRILSIERDCRVPNEFEMKAGFEFTVANSGSHTVINTHGQFNDWILVSP